VAGLAGAVCVFVRGRGLILTLPAGSSRADQFLNAGSAAGFAPAAKNFSSTRPRFPA
jgi:hypothetical protein